MADDIAKAEFYEGNPLVVTKGGVRVFWRRLKGRERSVEGFGMG